MRFAKYGVLLVAMVIGGCPGDFFEPGGPVTLTVDFDEGPQGWVADVADFSEAEADIIDFEARIADLPDEIDSNGRGYFVTSNNHPDDLFVFLRRQLGEADGLVPNQAYTFDYSVRFASNAPSGCIGAGGAPGESVYLKVGGATIEPEPLDPDDAGFTALNVDKGTQSTSGPAATVIGDIANGDECDDPDVAPYVSIVRSGRHDVPVTTDENAKLWLLVGTDSAFEGVTTMYYQSIAVTLTPVEPGE